MLKKISAFIVFNLLIISNLSASYYIKIGTTTAPVHQNGALPSLGLGGRLKCPLLDFDFSITGASKKDNSYVTAKALVLFFTGQCFYIGAGPGIGYGAKSPIIKLLKGHAKKTEVVNFEGVIGYEYGSGFIQLELTKPLYCKTPGHLKSDYKGGFALMFGTMF